MTHHPTTECNQKEPPFTSSQSREVEARFDGGDISSDGGLLLLREVDRTLDVLSRAAKLLDDPRETCKIQHSARSHVKQRVMALAQGYEDLNDHNLLRGGMENRIKEQPLGVFADRTSCHASWPNQLRLLMSTLAYVLIDGLTRLGLRGTWWATKQAGSLGRNCSRSGR